jgi:hypothetical protein
MEATKRGNSVVLPSEGEVFDSLPSLGQMRQKLSRADYEKYQQEKADLEMLRANDPVAYYLDQKAYFEKELKSENYHRRGKARAALDQLEILIESARKIAVEKAEMLKDVLYSMEDTVSELREAALQKGPTLFQKLRWMTGDALSRFGSWLSFIPKTLGASWRWYKRNCQWLALSAWIVAYVEVIGFSAFFNLGLNFLFFSLFLGILAAFSFIHEYDFKESFSGHPLYAAGLILALLFGTVSMTSWRCLAPVKGWMVVTSRGAEIVQVINSSEGWWMRSPDLLQGEKLEFTDLTNEIPGGHFGVPKEDLFRESWRREAGKFNGRPVVLNVSAQREVITSGLRQMVEEKKQLFAYRTDIQERVKVLLESFSSSDKNTVTASPELQEKILGVQNSVFWLKEVKVSLDF